MVFAHRNDPERAKHLLTSSHTVTFDKSSQGQLAAVIYEWSDVEHLGKTTSVIDDLPVSVGSRTAAANIDNSLLNVELAEDIHLYNRRTPFRLLRRIPARQVHYRLTVDHTYQPDQLLERARRVPPRR